LALPDDFDVLDQLIEAIHCFLSEEHSQIDVLFFEDFSESLGVLEVWRGSLGSLDTFYNISDVFLSVV
jgi:hypothetical protein